MASASRRSRTVVEVKHRQGGIGSQAIRSFLGGRHPQDKGLYVSTGGFSKDALYEAERASISLSLMTIDDLVEALIQNYDRLDIETQQILPLKRIYWPAWIGLGVEPDTLYEPAKIMGAPAVAPGRTLPPLGPRMTQLVSGPTLGLQ